MGVFTQLQLGTKGTHRETTALQDGFRTESVISSQCIWKASGHRAGGAPSAYVVLLIPILTGSI